MALCKSQIINIKSQIKYQFTHAFVIPGLIRNPVFFSVLHYWMPDRACPQLDWGSGMTVRNVMQFICTPLSNWVYRRILIYQGQDSFPDGVFTEAGFGRKEDDIVSRDPKCLNDMVYLFDLFVLG